MSWKKKLGIVIPVCCMAVTVVLCVLLYKEWTTPDMIEPPFKKLYWGMTLEEAYEVLEDVGLADEITHRPANTYGRDSELWTLTTEQAEKLGYTYPGKLALSENERYQVYIGFLSASKGGIVRLVSVAAMIEVDASHAVTSLDKVEYAEKQLIKEYGEPMRQGFWRYLPDGVEPTDFEARYYPNMSVGQTNRTGPREMLLCYSGAGYLDKNYGGEHYPLFDDLNS
ncbi:MAG: hypothetical protein IKU17_10925 [Clostridia bacterium]|nr:hypothetical protein [Clostridia bacterium]